ncbi:MAG: exopolysaccharide biosynthesis polyprenyl glycosylphosphotransferase [Caulobacteraceae bacterium]|nr:exopolysaccharide biosynthesis polyprenyl glycosylphosphotransferase [Caulobacteraceae bacterium]
MLAPAFKPGSDPERTPDGAAAGRVASDVAAVDALEAADDQATEARRRRGPFRPRKLVPARARATMRAPIWAFQLTDAAVAVALAGLAWTVTSPVDPLQAPVGAVLPFVMAAGVLLWALRALDLYRFGHAENLTRHLLRLSAVFALTGLTALAGVTLLDRGSTAPQGVTLWYLLAFASLYLLHVWWWTSMARWRRSGRLTPNIVVVGATENAEKFIAAALATKEVAVLGIFDDRIGRAPSSIAGVPVLGDINALLDHKIVPYVDKIVIAVTSTAQARVRQLVEKLRVLPNEITLFVDVEDDSARAAAVSRLADTPVAHISGAPQQERRAAVKRAQDLVIGALALVLSAPVMALVALAIRLDSPGPILFRQRRHGFNNEEIVVWKFRSMRAEDSDPRARRQVRIGDDRVTRVGRFIRRTSLDELPQILNVLTGEMSLVGPRPHAIGMMTGDAESARLVAEYAHRHRMKPGMTGWAAVNGSRGPVDTPELVRRRVALDIEYIERQSFWFDMQILAMTIPCLLGDRLAPR